MSCMYCDKCGRLVDTDEEEMYEHDGEQSYNSGVLCESCHEECEEHDEEQAKARSEDLKVDMEKERRVFGDDIHS